jgi:hypothetical protein
MRHDPTWIAPPGEDGGFGGQGTVQGPWVLPGRYEARLRVGEALSTQAIEIVGDPLATISDADRRYWHDLQVSLSHMLATARAASMTVGMLDDVLQQTSAAIEAGSVGREYPQDVLERVRRVTADVAELRREIGSISGTLGGLYGALRGSTSRPTSEQIRLAEVAYARLEEQLETVQWLTEQEMPVISGLLDGLGAPWTLGRPLTLPESARPPQRR